MARAIFSLGLAALLLVPSLARADRPSGFLSRIEGFTPFQLDTNTIDTPITVAPVEGLVIVIYNHGTRNAAGKENCMRTNAEPPASLRRLEGERLRVFFLCSDATDADGPQGVYVYRRVEEIRKTVARLVTAGVPASRIVLAGHSAGGWSSLMAQSTLDLGIAGVVAFAPAFSGPRVGESIGLTWRTVARPQQVQQLVSGRRLDALVFAYQEDEFEQPQDLQFLTRAFPNSVELIGYACPGLREAHMTHLTDCRAPDTAQRIQAFITRAVARATAEAAATAAKGAGR